MPDESHPTREVLLDAGVRLAERKRLLDTSIDEIVREAGLAKGTFYVHFKDRTALLVAMHRRFYEKLNAEIAAAVAGLPAGPERLRRGALAYLDGCLNAQAVKALLLEARVLDEIAAEVATRTTQSAALASRDFRAMRQPNPKQCGRLFVTMVAETALAELDRHAADAKLRAALWTLGGIGAARKTARSTS